ncbi:MAG: thiamine pyrophosphate-dependent dehydrogenase E1 component subunit alpha [Acidimicrobiia bacterium]|jgi:pyruvate dehydrogenase E1 component alpha subunit
MPARTAPLADLYSDMTRMRLFEEAIGDLWWRGLISGEMHLGIGEEGIIAGVMAHLDEGDAVALDHRPTAALLARGTDPKELLLEMLGREEGSGHGRGGHMHLFDRERLVASSGIVGSSAPLACGFALSGLRLRPGSVAVAFFGESAINQGMLMEALNLAVVWKLPVVFVCKDNGWAISTRSGEMTGGTPGRRADAFGIPAWRVDGSSVSEVWAVAGKAVNRARRGRGPGFLWATCQRPRGHFEDDPLLRFFEDPREVGGEIPRLARGSMDRSAGEMRARGAGTRRLIGTLARAAASRFGPRKDPIRRAAKGLDDSRLGALEAAARAEVDAVVREALEIAGVAP